MTEPFTTAKTIFARWLDNAGCESSSRFKILAAFDRLYTELSKRDAWLDVQTVALNDTEGMRFEAIRPHLRIGTCQHGLFVSTLTPGWEVDWRRIFNDDETYELLSWLMHYFRQYVHRSRMVGVLVALWEETEVVIHPFGSLSTYQRWGPMLPVIAPERALAIAAKEAQEEWPTSFPDVEFVDPRPTKNIPEQEQADPTKLASFWLDANMLDPHLHQASFHFLRACDLMAAGFEMEATVAVDCVLTVAKNFLIRRKLFAPNKQGRATLAEFFEAAEDQVEAARSIGLMRNHFGAHPGGWRWWDFTEMFEGNLKKIIPLANTILRGIVQLEPSHRLVAPSPERWSDWFWDNFGDLWRSVWFEEMTKWKPE